MGQLLNEKNIIEKNIILQLESSYTYQSKRLQGTPVYVTYFNKNIHTSTEDNILENVKEIVGGSSPIRYNKIIDMPIYLVNEINPNVSIDETFGFNTEANGEGVILPNMIKPYVDDIIIINYMQEDQFIFKVTNVEYDKVNGQKFYKIEYAFYPYERELVEEQTEEEYVVEYDNIGTKNNPIIETSNFHLIDRLEDFMYKIKKFYINSFMNNKYSVIIYKYNDKLLYNEFLIRFIKDNNVLKNRKKQLLNSYYIQDIFPDGPAFYELYESTIYYAIQEDTIDRLKCENMITMQIQKNYRDNPFSLDYEDYYRTIYTVNGSHEKDIKELDKSYENYKKDKTISLSYDDVFGKQNNANFGFYYDEDIDKQEEYHRHVLIEPHNSQLIKNIVDGIEFNDNKEYFLENILIRYFSGRLNIDDNFIDIIDKHNYFPSFKEYLLIPCLMFILDKEIDRLTNKK